MESLLKIGFVICDCETYNFELPAFLQTFEKIHNVIASGLCSEESFICVMPKCYKSVEVFIETTGIWNNGEMWLDRG